MTGGSDVVLDRRGPISVVRINQPEARNAITAEVVSGVGAAVLAATAFDYAERIVANGPLGVAACQELVRLWLTDADAAGARLDHWRARIFASEDAREGASAFIEERAPMWRGR